MRVRRADKNFTVRKKADRQIHYAGQGKKYTKSTTNLSPGEKRDALKVKDHPHAGAEKQAQNKISSVSNISKSYNNAAEEICQQAHKPSHYHERVVKTKEPVLHRKAEALFIDRPALKGCEGRRKEGFKTELPESGKIWKPELPIPSKGKKSSYAMKSRKAGNGSTENGFAIGRGVQDFSVRREEQISRFKKKIFSQKGKEKARYGKKYVSRGVELKVQGTHAQDPALLRSQDNFPSGDAGHLHTRNLGSSIHRREEDIPGRKRDKETGGRSVRKGGNSKWDKGKRNRAAAFRLLTYASDKLAREEQKDSLLKVAKDLLVGKIKAAATGKLVSLLGSTVALSASALIPAFIMAVIITFLFNSPFAILLPKLSEGPGVVEVLLGYTESFREKVEQELADPGRGDETELIYEDYEGDGEPDNMADILMVYMVKHGFGDTATLMTKKNKKALKDTFDEMTSMQISYRKEMVEQSYEEKDRYGNITVKIRVVELKIKEVRVRLLTSEDIIRTGIFMEEEEEILRYLMSPEILECIEGLTGGYGNPGMTELTPEQEERLSLGGDTGSQAVKNALARLGKPYSQAYRDSGDYYDCSSLTYYAYKEAGINLSYHGSNTAASQARLLADRGCEIAYEDIQPGDLIFYSFTRNGRYKNISHVAVYAGNGSLVDASFSKGYVVFRPVYSTGKIVMCGRPSWL